MRKLVWFCVGVVLAALIGAYFLSGNTLLLPAGIAFAMAVVLCFVKTDKAKIAVTILAGLLCGLVWSWGYDLLYLHSARALDGEKRYVQITATDYSFDTQYGIGADGKVKIDGKSYKVRFYSQEDSLAPGDRVTGTFAFRFTGEGGKSDSVYHRGKGIFLIASTNEKGELKRAEKLSAAHFPAVLRRQIGQKIAEVFPEDTAGFARALLLGDSSDLSDTDSNNLSVSGVRHVIAVSGLHVSILFSLVYLLCAKRRALTALLGIPILLLFAAVAGFTPSITRACVMQILMILSLLVNKEYDPPTSLAFAVLVILGINPLAVSSVSFQLSVGCMVGIFLFSGKLYNHLLPEKTREKVKNQKIKGSLYKFAAGSVSVTLSAMVVTVPLCAYHFGMVSLAGIITNMLILPVITVIFYGVMLSCIVGALVLPVGQFLAAVCSLLIRYVLGVATVASALPGAAVYTLDPYLSCWLVVCYVLLAVFMLGKRKRLRVLVACICVCFAVSFGLSCLEKTGDTFSFTVLDVGQGQCVIFKNKDHCYVVDCGGDNSADLARQALYTQGVQSLNGIIVTHYDSDHAGDVKELASTFPVETLYLPDVPDEGTLREELVKQFSDDITWVREDRVLQIPDGSVTIFSDPQQSSENERSLCILFQQEKCDILVTGDRGVSGEASLVASGKLPKLEILVAGHHGSAGATGLELLKETQPDHCVISVGENNSYGHPAGDTLERLKIFNCRVWRTDINGTIQFKG